MPHTAGDSDVALRPGRGLPRGFDAVVAGVGLVVVAPLLLTVLLAVRLTSRGPALFRQARIGRGGRPFTLLKVRSMRSAATVGAQITARGDARITTIGRWIRRFKLDELPQLWNVVRGDMALVGPRPEVPRYVDTAAPAWRPVLAVRPGLTDPVTLALRDEEAILASADDAEDFYRRVLLPFKLKGYAAYVADRTPRCDLGVLVATVLAIVRLHRPPALTRETIERPIDAS